MPIEVPGLPGFGAAYQEAVTDVLPFLGAEATETIAKHNQALVGWSPESYLRLSELRYARALRAYASSSGTSPSESRVLDTGAYTGAFALSLARLGLDVTVTEAFSLYGGAFDGIRRLLEREGVTVVDLDVTAPDAQVGSRFDLVANMAMVEHLAHTPRPLMENLKRHLRPTGRLVLDTPNVAAWPKRVEALLGRSTLPPLETVYRSAEPFTGHHREYTPDDVRRLLELAGLRLHGIETFNYTPLTIGGWRQIAYDWPRRRLASCREVILACASLPTPRRA